MYIDKSYSSQEEVYAILVSKTTIKQYIKIDRAKAICFGAVDLAAFFLRLTVVFGDFVISDR